MDLEGIPRQPEGATKEGDVRMSDPSRLTATEASRLIADGKLHPAELMEACLERCAAREDALHAMAHLDPALARQGARAARQGPLHGIPVGVKDVLDTADMPTEYGSPIWRGWRPGADSAAVAAARSAGAVVIGKTVTTEFAVRHPGPTVNPHNPAHTPGGSSSGSAAGVAASLFPLAFATQTAGSIIRPAAFCGVVGYKPSFGTLHRAGMKVMSESLDTIGFMARSVEDCALFAQAVSGRDTGDPASRPPRAPRIGLCRSPVWDRALPETQALFERVAQQVARAGAQVEERELPSGFAGLEAAHATVQNGESARALAWEMSAARDRISAELLEKLDAGAACTLAQIDAARAVLASCRNAFGAAMEGLDVLLTPSASGEAPAGLSWTGDPVFNFIWTSLHVPCVTVPAGAGPRGLPLGIQVVGRQGEDRATLSWAQWVGAAVG
jgi:Asp-tRNA(Asn)/Glu-tRNA(Gln) amidotransferase A subunit family amidase